jgi:DNA repair photolyase
MKLTYQLLITLLLTGCGSAFHVKQYERHLRKAIEKGAKVNVDTTYTLTKLKVEGIKVRFIPKPIFPNGDTIYFEKERVLTKVLLKHDSIFVETNCPDTVYQFKTHTITKTVTAVQNSWLKWWMLVIAAAAGALLGILKR